MIRFSLNQNGFPPFLKMLDGRGNLWTLKSHFLYRFFYLIWILRQNCTNLRFRMCWLCTFPKKLSLDFSVLLSWDCRVWRVLGQSFIRLPFDLIWFQVQRTLWCGGRVIRYLHTYRHGAIIQSIQGLFSLLCPILFMA